eukprot:scaffold3300_cov239-Pinguiococcus_pyrenoidosus.AAC.1
MERRSWHVKSLEEFLPTNPGLLGLNVNRRQAIKVRLRRNGSLSFLPYEDILGTVLHELCHIVFSKHDKQFFALLDELWTEIETGASRLPAASAREPVAFSGSGKAVGGARKAATRDEMRSRRLEAAQKRQKIQDLGKGSGRRLGGRPLERLSPAELRRRVRAAAERRRVADTICATAASEGMVEVLDSDEEASDQRDDGDAAKANEVVDLVESGDEGTAICPPCRPPDGIVLIDDDDDDDDDDAADEKRAIIGCTCCSTDVCSALDLDLEVSIVVAQE